MERDDRSQKDLALAECAEITLQLPRAEITVTMQPAELEVEMAPAELTTELNQASVQRLPPPWRSSEAQRNPKPPSKLWFYSLTLHGVALAVALALVPSIVRTRGAVLPDRPLLVVSPHPETKVIAQPSLKAAPPDAPQEEPVVLLQLSDVPEVVAEDAMEPAEAALAIASSEPSPSAFMHALSIPRLNIKRPPQPVEAVKLPAEAASPPRVSGATQGPRLTTPLQPRYPESQRRNGQTASVKACVWIDATGKPERWDFLPPDAHQDFQRSAEDALREVRFIPAQRDGVAVSGKILITFEFRLR